MKAKMKINSQHVQDYREAIGKSLRFIREKRGYSQDDLAEIMEVHRSTISKIETGKFAITVDYMVKFGWYLEFDIKLVEKEK